MGRGKPSFFDQHSVPLDERIAIGLHKLGLAMKHQAWLQAAEDGMSPTQGQILAALSAEGPRSGTELAARLGVSLPTVSDSARVLVDKGLAVKRPDPRHPRASLLELTGAGTAAAAKARSWPEFLATAVLALTEAEQEAFLASLVKMIRTIQERGQIPINRMCVTCTHFQPNVHAGPLPHHCGFVDAPMANRHLRLDCTDHADASPEAQAQTWSRFVSTD